MLGRCSLHVADWTFARMVSVGGPAHQIILAAAPEVPQFQTIKDREVLVL